MRLTAISSSRFIWEKNLYNKTSDVRNTGSCGGGIPGLIQLGKIGGLFESGNAEDLKKKVQELWEDKKPCEKYSVNCKNISFDTIDEYYEKITNVYKNISVRRSIGGK